MAEVLKLCIDCKWARKSAMGLPGLVCVNPLTRQLHSTEDKMWFPTCSENREDKFGCGPEGRFWEMKEDGE